MTADTQRDSTEGLDFFGAHDITTLSSPDSQRTERLTGGLGFLGVHDRVGGADPNAVGIVAQQHECGGGVLEVGGDCGLPQPHVLRNTGHSLQQ